MKIALIKLKSYTFLHLGRERWKRVTKRSWSYIPGSTLFGSVASNLIRLDCKRGKATPRECCLCLKEKSIICGYKILLENVRDGKIRFSPLIQSDTPVTNALKYCESAINGKNTSSLTAHAPINRRELRIHKDQLYGLIVHNPFREYWGFVLAEEDFIKNHLQRALRLFPVSSFGGRGKFSQVEATISTIENLDSFTASLKDLAMNEIILLTPAILDGPDVFQLLGNAEYLNFGLRRYRVWRTGLYWEGVDPPKVYGITSEEKKIEDSHQTAGRLALIDGTKIRIKNPNKNELIDSFIRGIGHKDWTYLGWGQIILS